MLGVRELSQAGQHFSGLDNDLVTNRPEPVAEEPLPGQRAPGEAIKLQSAAWPGGERPQHPTDPAPPSSGHLGQDAWSPQETPIGGQG